MFFMLLVVTLFVAPRDGVHVVLLFRRPIRQILDRIIGPELAHAFRQRFLLFAIYVVGSSSGVQIWKLEQYIRAEGGPKAASRSS